MIHFYTAKIGGRYGSTVPVQIKLLCTKEYVPFRSRGSAFPNGVTAAVRVTCPACLRVLIPIEEKRLTMMRANLLLAEPAGSA
jgi:hypothetical protein